MGDIRSNRFPIAIRQWRKKQKFIANFEDDEIADNSAGTTSQTFTISAQRRDDIDLYLSPGSIGDINESRQFHLVSWFARWLVTITKVISFTDNVEGKIELSHSVNNIPIKVFPFGDDDYLNNNENETIEDTSFRNSKAHVGRAVHTQRWRNPYNDWYTEPIVLEPEADITQMPGTIGWVLKNKGSAIVKIDDLDLNPRRRTENRSIMSSKPSFQVVLPPSMICNVHIERQVTSNWTLIES